ncbi:MAG: winged helix-turn-helix transcriptional regulator [Catenulispora sp.]|nr:winged helix-turn-helix transcriptional regulator [Catenulispora sp.]
MLRIDLGADGLARTRFVVSPLRTAGSLLYAFGDHPYLLSGQWRARASQALDSRNLRLLAALSSPVHNKGYAVDFISPEPAAFDNDIEQELHHVATTGTERVGHELLCALTGHPMVPITPTLTRSAPAVLLKAAERGEHFLAEQVAAELEQFWKLALAPHWSHIRQSLEDDITARATITARNGFDHMIGGLHPNLTWQDGGLNIHLPVPDAREVTATAVILAPSVFVHVFDYLIDPADAPARRVPTITYRAIRSPSASRPRLDELIGTTRVHLLAALATPHSTDELAERLHLSRSTVSYHLQILYRAGLLHRNQHNRVVYYQVIPRTKRDKDDNAAAEIAHLTTGPRRPSPMADEPIA